MSFKDHPHSRGPASSDGASRPARERSDRNGDDRTRGGKSFGSRDERGPRREGGFGGGDRPRFDRAQRDDRGPRPERSEQRSFGGSDRPRREDGGFGRSDRPRFNDERAPRREGGFGGGDRPNFSKDRGPRPERSDRNFGDRKPGLSKGPRQASDRRSDERGQPFERSFEMREGETRRAFSGIRAYRAPEALKGKAAPVKIIRPEDKLGDKND